ncbi:glycosyltransferase [Flavobacterium sp. xlx-214]|uniref:glycosyltransferase family 2 protein n=1 Tax=unclassified Flavobacterium TaxID=196869 RepID=UPI0013D33D9F|nr:MULTISPECIES: glycosyltransferase family 2 protein [unclassified Flavobacterium]MBA5794034.1 glycosyltransferase [Flavobacterium sp. xlx-221]QMI83151.1 glycosyltransferase [Flavobacterium sp. xlx-214]
MLLKENKIPLLSIIIPIYNVEKYLVKCVSSVLDQNYQNIEVILVDDGSPDNCSQICDDFAKKDNRIKVIHKENGGLSDARNVGIRAATGEYLMFLDSDDYWEGDIHLGNIAAILEKDQSIDTILFRCKHLYSPENKIYDRNSLVPSTNSIKDPNLKLIEMIKHGSQSSSACLRAVKRELILKNNIFFVKDLIGEDSDWFIHLCLVVKKQIEYPKAFYVYRQNRDGSITSEINKKTFSDQLYIIDKWTKIIDNNNYEDNLKLAMRGFIAYLYCILLLKLSKLSEVNFELFYDEINKRKKILKYSLNNKSVFIKYMVKLLGMKYTIKLVGFIYIYIEKFRKRN